MPTLAQRLAGHLLGTWHGGLVAWLGLLAAGGLCFSGARLLGPRFPALRSQLNVGSDRAELNEWFHSGGNVALVFARTLPMLPEVLSCLAGLSQMSVLRYVLLYAPGNLAYALFVARAGAHSSLADPGALLWAALLIWPGGWLCWWLFRAWNSAGQRRGPIV